LFSALVIFLQAAFTSSKFSESIFIPRPFSASFKLGLKTVQPTYSKKLLNFGSTTVGMSLLTACYKTLLMVFLQSTPLL